MASSNVVFVTWIELGHSNHMITESAVYFCATENLLQISHRLIHQFDLKWFESMLEIAETLRSRVRIIKSM